MELLDYVKLLKYVFVVVGIGLVMMTKIRYQQRNASNPDKSEPYNAAEKKMLYTGYGFCALAILFVLLFN